MADQDARELFDRLNPIPETPRRNVTESEPESEWEREQRFWREHPIDRFDLDECGSGYMSYRDMRLNETGEWIRSDDHRKVVSELAARVKELEDALARANESGDAMFADLHETRRELDEWRNG